MPIDLAEAAAKLPELIQAAERGEDFAITRDGQPVAKIVAVASPQAAPQKERVFGAYKGRLKVGP